MGNILSSFKQGAIEVKERVCGVGDLFRYEDKLQETVIAKFQFDADEHYRRAEYYTYEDEPKNAKLR